MKSTCLANRFIEYKQRTSFSLRPLVVESIETPFNEYILIACVNVSSEFSNLRNVAELNSADPINIYHEIIQLPFFLHLDVLFMIILTIMCESNNETVSLDFAIYEKN